jgi:antitoxin YefM
MREVSVNKFRANIKNYVDQTISEHEPIKVRRRSGHDFIVINAEDWERDQETLYILNNSSLMKQISSSSKTYKAGTGYKPSKKELDEINCI